MNNKQKQNRLKIIKKDVEIKMLRINNHCFIKILPLYPISVPTNLQFYLNGEHYSLDIYNKEGRETHIIYFEGLNCIPCFYLRVGKEEFKIKFYVKNIIASKIKKIENLELYLKKECNFNSTKASCWAKDVFFTSRPDKFPFNEM